MDFVSTKRYLAGDDNSGKGSLASIRQRLFGGFKYVLSARLVFSEDPSQEFGVVSNVDKH